MKTGSISALLAMALLLVALGDEAVAGLIQAPVWVRDTEKLGYYKITAGQIAASEIHNPGTSISPNKFWEVTVTALTEQNGAPDRVNATGDMSHITAVTGHAEEEEAGGRGKFNLTVSGNEPSNDSGNTDKHLPDHEDLFGFRLDAAAPFGTDISGYTFSAVGYHPDGEVRVQDSADFNVDSLPFAVDDLIPGAKKTIDKTNSSDAGYEKTISPRFGSAPALTLLAYSFEFEIGAVIGANVFDAVLTQYLFEFAPFDVDNLTGINRQILDPDQVLVGLFDKEALRFVLPAQTLWLNVGGNAVARSEELFIFDLPADADGTVNGFELQSTGTFVPEPGTLGLLGLGMVALAFCRRRRSPH